MNAFMSFLEPSLPNSPLVLSGLMLRTASRWNASGTAWKPKLLKTPSSFQMNRPRKVRDWIQWMRSRLTYDTVRVDRFIARHLSFIEGNMRICSVCGIWCCHKHSSGWWGCSWELERPSCSTQKKEEDFLPLSMYRIAPCRWICAFDAFFQCLCCAFCDCSTFQIAVLKDSENPVLQLVKAIATDGVTQQTYRRRAELLSVMFEAVSLRSAAIQIDAQCNISAVIAKTMRKCHLFLLPSLSSKSLVWLILALLWKQDLAYLSLPASGYSPIHLLQTKQNFHWMNFPPTWFSKESRSLWGH